MVINNKYGLQERCDIHVLGTIHHKGISFVYFTFTRTTRLESSIRLFNCNFVHEYRPTK